METEEWRPVVGREGSYEVSSHGRLRSLSRQVGPRYIQGKLMSPGVHPAGHLKVALAKDGVKVMQYVHRLVLEAFVGPCPDGMECLHGDGDPKNNHISNLRWGTREENVQDSMRHGTHRSLQQSAGPRGLECPRGHLKTGANLVPSKLAQGVRECVACRRAHGHARSRSEPFSAEVADRYYAAIRATEALGDLIAPGPQLQT